MNVTKTLAATNKSPFKVQHSIEVLADEVAAKSPADLIIALFAIALCFGLPRTEAAIKATYAPAQAMQVIGGMNLAMSQMGK